MCQGFAIVSPGIQNGSPAFGTFDPVVVKESPDHNNEQGDQAIESKRRVESDSGAVLCGSGDQWGKNREGLCWQVKKTRWGMDIRTVGLANCHFAKLFPSFLPPPPHLCRLLADSSFTSSFLSLSFTTALHLTNKANGLSNTASHGHNGKEQCHTFHAPRF
jgi:hypothetical protein